MFLRQLVQEGVVHATAGGEPAIAARRCARAVSKESVIAALARDTRFGYERVGAVIRASMQANSDDQPFQASSPVLRALLAECADAHSARALARVEVPATIAGQYDGSIARIRMIAESASDDYFRLDNDPYNKDLAICLGQLYPNGARLTDLHAALPLWLILKQPLPTVSQVRFLWEAGRCSPWFENHIDTRELSEFNQLGLVHSYLRVAALLEANPHVGGVFGESWFLDPCLETLSPHLTYLQRLPCDFGARLFHGRTNALTIRRALLKSKRRRDAYERGIYRPQTYLLVWPRREILRWARAQSSEAHERTWGYPAGDDREGR